MTKIIYTDGATEGANGRLGTVTHCGIGFYCVDDKFEYSERIEAISNNEAEFIALKKAMIYALGKGYYDVEFRLDSMIVVNRANGHTITKPKNINERMDKFQNEILTLKMWFHSVRFVWVPREKNRIADKLSKASLKPRQYYDY